MIYNKAVNPRFNKPNRALIIKKVLTSHNTEYTVEVEVTTNKAVAILNKVINVIISILFLIKCISGSFIYNNQQVKKYHSLNNMYVYFK